MSKDSEWSFLGNSLVQGGIHTTGGEIKAEKSILSEVMDGFETKDSYVLSRAVFEL